MRRLAAWLFVAAAFAFLGYFVARNAAVLREHEWTLRPGLLIGSLALQIGALLLGVAVWQSLLRGVGHRVEWWELARIWFVSGLGRYIPGKVWQFVGAAHLGANVGLPATVTVTSLAVHTGVFLVAAVLLGIFAIPAAALGAVGGSALVALRWLGPLALLLVHPRAIAAVLSFVQRVTRRPLASWTGSWLDGIRLLAFAAIAWAIAGAAFFLFVLSITPLAAASLASVVGINALSFAAGYLAFFVPAGLGAKEGALAALLALHLPAPVAAVIAIAARLWTVVAEVLPAAVVLLGGRR